jgi:tetratricopeptide (TPR) repeat protein
MTRSSGAVRSLRYRLGSALAESVDDEGRTRVADAVAEFDRALAEAGSTPSDARIQLAAGRLLEDIDPVEALGRYLGALDGDATDESASRARALLARSPQPTTLVASLPTEAIEKVAHAALHPPAEKTGFLRSAIGKVAQATSGRPAGDLSLLAATLLRRSGADEKALELLQSAYDASRSPGRELVTELAETMLDLERVDDALQLTEREDPHGRDVSLQLVRAEGHLIRGEFETSLGLTGDIEADSAPPAAATARALSLLGLGRGDEAVQSLPETDAPAVHLARAVIHLQRLEYPPAREASWSLLRARPNDPDALLINAQTVLEALGEAREDESSSETAAPETVGSAHRGGAEIDAARELLDGLAKELPALGPRSRWWHVQAAIRKDDARFRFFCCALRFATRQGPSIEEIDTVDRSRTTWLQDAALDEFKARLLQAAGDTAGAATAYDAACRIFGDSVGDRPRAAAAAQAAYELLPTAARAAEYADRALSESYELDADSAEARATSAGEVVKRWLSDADDDELGRLMNLLAWLRVRLTELPTTRPRERVSALLPWLFAGVAVRPDDALLRAVLASQLVDLDQKAGAVLFAEDAFAGEPSNAYVVETAIVAAANYYAELEKLRPFLRQHAAVSDDESWRNAVELVLCVTAGDRKGVEERAGLPLSDKAWAKRDRAVATAFQHGLEAAAGELEDALDTCLHETPPSLSDAVFLDAVLRRRDDAARHLAEAARDVETNEASLPWSELLIRFAFEPELTAEEYFAQALELCDSPNDISTLVNVTLPILAAARSGEAGPVREVPVDQDLRHARLRVFDDLRACFFQELERHRTGLSWLARLADRRTGPVLIESASRQASDVWPEELPESVLERIGRIVAQRARLELPSRLLEARFGREAAIGEEDVLRVLQDDSGTPRRAQLAVALLAPSLDNRTRKRVAANASEDDVDAAVEEVLRAAERTGLRAPTEAIDDYWMLDALLQDVEDESSAPSALRDTAAATRSKLCFRLDELLQVSRDSAEVGIPIVTPIVVEVGDGLVPIVDSNQDGGVFLYELIPAVRERIRAGTGVTVPGLRMRGDAYGAPGSYRVQVDEVEVLTGSVPLEASFTVRPARDGSRAGELTDVHPLTGERGLWVLAADAGGARPDGAETLTTAQYLLHNIELAIRAHLARFLGPQEVATLVESWLEEEAEADLVASVLPDEDARLRLTWVLQQLVTDGVPITDWRTVLDAVREAGGITAPTQALRRAARAALRDSLAAPQTGRRPVRVPYAHEAALLGEPLNGDGGARSSNESRHDFMRWLRETVAETGPAVTLVTHSQDARELVALLARAEDRLIMTVSENELRPR